MLYAPNDFGDLFGRRMMKVRHRLDSVCIEHPEITLQCDGRGGCPDYRLKGAHSYGARKGLRSARAGPGRLCRSNTQATSLRSVRVIPTGAPETQQMRSNDAR